MASYLSYTVASTSWLFINLFPAAIRAMGKPSTFFLGYWRFPNWFCNILHVHCMLASMHWLSMILTWPNHGSLLWAELKVRSVSILSYHYHVTDSSLWEKCTSVICRPRYSAELFQPALNKISQVCSGPHLLSSHFILTFHVDLD